MPESGPQGMYVPPGTNTPFNNNRLKIIVIASVVLILMLVVGIFTLSSKKKSMTTGESSFNTNTPQPGSFFTQTVNDKSTINLNTQAPASVPNSSISKSTLNWLISIKSDGLYPNSLNCDANKNCDPPIKDNLAGISVIWGEYKYYEATKDQSILSMLSSDLNTYADQNKVSTIQNDFWNCKLMYELNSSSSLNQQQRDNAQKICERGIYFPGDYAEINSKLQSNNVKELDLQKVMNNQTLVQSSNADPNRFASFSSYASDFAFKYKWFSKDTDLKTAIVYFNKAVEVWQNNKDDSQDYNNLMLAIASLDMYNALGKQQYIDFANYLIAKDNNRCTTLEACVAYVSLMQELYGYIKNNQYLTNAQVTLEKIKGIGYSSIGGNSAFHSFDINTPIDNYVYPTRFNGILVGLYAKIN